MTASTTFTDLLSAEQPWRHRDPLNRFEYPTSNNWKEFSTGSALAHVETSLKAQHPAILHGPPKTGKTFHALLLGHAWCAQKKSRAFYGLASGLSVLEVERQQWSDPIFRGTRCLWIVDDIHDGLQLCEELLDLFDSMELAALGHRLLFIGWSIPRALEKLAVEKSQLTPDLIHLALARRPEGDVPIEWVQKLAESRLVSLAEILWAATEDRELLAQADRLADEYVHNRFDGLDTRALEVVHVLAAFRFLGIEFHSRDMATAEVLAALERLGIADRTDSGGWSLLEEQAAWQFLRRAARDVPDSAFKVITDPVIRAVRSNPALIGDVVVALARTAESMVWGSIAEPREMTGSKWLLQRLEDADLAALGNIAVHSGTALPAAMRAALALRSLLPAEYLQRFATARAAAITAVLEIPKVRDWELVARISEFLPDTPFLASLREAVAKPAFRHDFATVARGEAGSIVRHVRQYDVEAFRALSMQFYADLGTHGSTAVWKTFHRVATVDADLAIAVIRRISPELLRKHLLRSPRRCVDFVSPLRGENRSIVGKLLRDSLGNAVIQQSDIDDWTTEREAVGAIQLAHAIGSPHMLGGGAFETLARKIAKGGRPGLVIDLVHSIAAWKQAPDKLRRAVTAEILSRPEDQQEGSPAFSPTMSLMMLDPATTKQRVREDLKSIPDENEVDSAKLFWRLRNGVVLLGMSDERVLRFANAIATTWTADRATSMGSIFLAGLVAATLQIPTPTLRIEPLDTERVRGAVSSPTLSVAHLCAVAYAGEETALPDRETRLEGLLRAFEQPSRPFRGYWTRHQFPLSRRAMNLMIMMAIDRLMVDAQTRDRAVSYCAAQAQPEVDFMWAGADDLRFRLVSHAADLELLRALLVRRQTAFLSLSGMADVAPHVLLRLLLSAVLIAGNSDDGEPAARAIVQGLLARPWSREIDAEFAWTKRQLLNVVDGKPIDDRGARRFQPRSFVTSTLLFAAGVAVSGMKPPAMAGFTPFEWERAKALKIIRRGRRGA